MLGLLNCSCVGGCIVVSHCDLNLDFSSNVENLFMCLFAIHISLLVKCLFIDFVFFFITLVF